MLNKDLQAISITLPGSSIEAYAAYANAIPMLSQEQEFELARRLQEDNDLDAARELVLSHLRFVVRVARGYSGYGLAVADLIQEGNIGLMKAVKRFDPKMGVRLAAYAVHWIKAEMHEFILRNWRIVRVATTKSQRKLFFNLRKMKKRLGWFSEEEIKGVASDLDVPADTVREMEARLNVHDTALDVQYDGETYALPAPQLEDHQANPALMLEQHSENENIKMQLHSALLTLGEREQVILQERWLQEKKATLQDLSKRFGVSLERIRQLEKAALKKLKDLIAA